MFVAAAAMCCPERFAVERCNAPRRGGYNKDSRKQAAHLFSFLNTLDADGHGRGAMRDLMRFCPSNYLRKRMLQDAEKFVGHFHFRPQVGLQALHPLKVRNDYAACVA